MMPKLLSLVNKFFIIFCILFYCSLSGQTSNLDLLQKQDLDVKLYPERKVEFLKAKTLVGKINPLRYIFGGLLFGYQKLISPQIARQCPYEISCSAFSKQSIQKYGIFKGLALSADRLSRCTRTASYDIKLTNINLRTNQIIDSLEFYHHAHLD